MCTRDQYFTARSALLIVIENLKFPAVVISSHEEELILRFVFQVSPTEVGKIQKYCLNIFIY